MNIPSEEVTIHAGTVMLQGNLHIPEGVRGLVLFAHGSGSSRFSPRNKFVAEMLQQQGLATLLMDLLTEEEENIDIQTREYRFDIPLLAERLVGAIQWLTKNPKTKDVHVGCFGSSTGAAAALIAAATLPHDVHAVVSRGGRPDLAMEYLPKITAPTLLIVGGNDTEVIGMNTKALQKLQCEKKLEIVPGATHLFEEPGKLEDVAQLAAHWFVLHLRKK